MKPAVQGILLFLFSLALPGQESRPSECAELLDKVGETIADSSRFGPAMLVEFALRTDESTFWIVDAFPGDAERQAHLDGQIAKALLENAERLLSGAPEILPADVLAAKVP